LLGKRERPFPVSNLAPALIHRFSARGVGVPARGVGGGGGAVPRVGVGAQRRPRLRPAPAPARQASATTRTTTAHQGQVRHTSHPSSGRGKGAFCFSSRPPPHGGRRVLSCVAYLSHVPTTLPLPCLLFPSVPAIIRSTPKAPGGSGGGSGKRKPRVIPLELQRLFAQLQLADKVTGSYKTHHCL
jgi:hypothetical protein